MQEVLSNYSRTNTEEMEQDIIKLQKQKKKIELLKDKMDRYFRFNVPTDLIVDIAENEDYNHFCLMINLAVENNRLKESEGDKLKQGIKEICNIKNNYDELNAEIITGEFDYEEWSRKYHTEEIIDIKKYLNRDDIKILKKLSIPVKDKVLTNYEYDVLKGYVLEYYKNEEEMTSLELLECKSLDGTGVTREEYNKLLNKFENISKEFNIF